VSALRRARAYAGQLALLAVLALVAAALAAGAPRAANRMADAGLRADLDELPHSVRDLTFVAGSSLWSAPGDGPRNLSRYRQAFPAPLPGLIGGQWYITETAPLDLGAGSCPQLATVRWETGADQAVRLVRGRRPASSALTETMIGRDAADALGLHPGDTVTLGGRAGGTRIRVVGVFEPLRAADPIWADMALARTACPSVNDGLRWRATLLTDRAGARLAIDTTGVPVVKWRYRLDTARLSADRVAALMTAVIAVHRRPPTGTTLRSSLDLTLSTFDGRLRAVRALLAVVQAGVLAALLGLILLAARLTVDRRRDEYALLRARGAGGRAVAARTLTETLIAVPVAVAAGWFAGAAVPGRAGPSEALLVLGAGLVATLAPAAFAVRDPGFLRPRQDTVRPSPGRLTAEGLVVGLAVLGVLLLRRRGLGTGVDPYLILVPVLLALAAALLALRLVPLLLRRAGRLAARARGAVGFLGLAGAGRGAPLSAGPLAVLVVTIATGVFAGVVTSTVDHARDLAADREVPADARVDGFAFAPDTAAAIARLPGITRVTPVLLRSGAEIRGPGSVFTEGQLMVLDAATAGLDLPAALRTARPGAAPVPALVSPELARSIPTGGRIFVQGRAYEFRIAAVRDTAPGLAVGARRFIVLPRQAMAIPSFEPLIANRFLLAGDRFDPAAVRAAADAGQRAYARQVTGRPGQLTVPATITTWRQQRAALADTGVNGLLTFAFTAGVAAATVLALLAVGFTVLAGAPARGRTLSRLRTMGLSGGQGRRLLVLELVPMIGVALLAGALAGIALPALIGPALALSGFTAGVPARTHLDPLLAGGVLIVAGLAMVAALTVENVVNRRLRLGAVLRLGEEN
jgi:putative ABC transport system permease protein